MEIININGRNVDKEFCLPFIPDEDNDPQQAIMVGYAKGTNDLYLHIWNTWIDTDTGKEASGWEPLVPINQINLFDVIKDIF